MNRRAFMANSAAMAGGLTLLSGTSLLAAACGDDDDAGTASGTVATQFNWVPDIEWSAWYLAKSKNYFSDRGVTVDLNHGGPNTPSVVQVLAAGDGNLGLSASELDLVKANAEGSDFVALGAMYQKGPLGYTWMTATGIEGPEDLVGKRIGGIQGDQLQIDAIFRLNGLEADYEFVPMGYDPQVLADGEMDVISSYVTNQPIQLRLQGLEVSAAPYSDFGLPAYGDILFASRAWLDDNEDLAVAYLAALLEGVNDNRADPSESLALLVDDYGAEAEINAEYAEAANPEYIALMDSDYTEANGLLTIDPDRISGEIWAGLTEAGESDLPDVSDFLDGSYLKAAHEAIA